MQTVTLYKVCPQCVGSGEYVSGGGSSPPSTTPCLWPGCDGDGFVTLGKCELDPGLDDLLDRVNDVLNKCNDILEKCNEILGGG